MTDTRGPGRVGPRANPGENRSSGATSLERGWGGKGESKGRWLFLLGAGQRVEGSLSQQLPIGSCCPDASPDWTICSGRCSEARRGGTSRRVGASPGPGNWVRRAAAVRWAPRRRDLERGAAEPPFLRSSRSAERG